MMQRGNPPPPRRRGVTGRQLRPYTARLYLFVAWSMTDLAAAYARMEAAGKARDLVAGWFEPTPPPDLPLLLRYLTSAAQLAVDDWTTGWSAFGQVCAAHGLDARWVAEAHGYPYVTHRLTAPPADHVPTRDYAASVERWREHFLAQWDRAVDLAFLPG